MNAASNNVARAGRIVRTTVRAMLGALASTVVACNTSTLTEPNAPVVAMAQQPIVNQAIVYGRPVAFDKGRGNEDGSRGGLAAPSGPTCLLPDSLALDVGPDGASFSYGGTSIVFPKNAVSSTVHIVMIPQLDATASVQFFPEGLQFNPAALPTLTINTACIGNPPRATIVYTNALGQILEFEPSREAEDGHSVTANIAHFSRYAVAW